MFQEEKELTTTEVQHPCLPKWRARISEAEQRGTFTKRERSEACDWNLCAVGEAQQQKYQIAPNDKSDAWIDQELGDLGVSFATRVSEDDFAGCLKTIDAIEGRLSELKPQAGHTRSLKANR